VFATPGVCTPGYIEDLNATQLEVLKKMIWQCGICLASQERDRLSFLFL
jgi:hypothetical protein